MHSAKKKGLGVELQQKEALNPLYEELERLIRKLKKGTNVRTFDISEELLQLIAVPNGYLPPAMKNVVWRLLVRLSPVDIMKLYQYNKEGFFHFYQEWKDGQKAWAVDYLHEHYIGEPEEEYAEITS